jgi:hypothetical protein
VARSDAVVCCGCYGDRVGACARPGRSAYPHWYSLLTGWMAQKRTGLVARNPLLRRGLVLRKWARVFSPRDLYPWFLGLNYWSRVVRLFSLRHHLPGLVLSDSDTLSPSAPIANKASAYAPPAPTTHMRPTHKDSSPARTGMPSHMPRAYAVRLESRDNRSTPTLVTHIPMKTTTHLLPGGPRASPELVRY